MNLACIAADTDKAQSFHQKLNQRHAWVEPSEADVILALGGDGLMLHALHRNLEWKKPLYGLNCGTVGFLMNELKDDDLLARVESLAEQNRVIHEEECFNLNPATNVM
ncbi:MAG: NAD(+)/NADH kinase, partial [Planctomycetota bacterium]